MKIVCRISTHRSLGSPIAVYMCVLQIHSLLLAITLGILSQVLTSPAFSVALLLCRGVLNTLWCVLSMSGTMFGQVPAGCFGKRERTSETEKSV